MNKRAPRVAIIGGGLAGLAAASALSERGIEVDLYESRRRLGGRAASFRDPASDELIDHCQHVGMACCTNLIEFCRRTGIAELFRRDRTLHFFAPDGRRYDVAAAPLLPAPLHLLPSLLRLGYLTLGERIDICRAMLRLARADVADDRQTVGAWLREQRQSLQAIELFWAPVLVSALGESIERASLKHAKKVFVDGFLVNRDAYQIEVPTAPLGELYGPRLEASLSKQGVKFHLNTAIESIDVGEGGRWQLALGNGETYHADAVVCAVPWRRATALLAESLRRRLPGCENWATLAAAPISGVHLWFDRELTDLPHAVLLGTLAQWVFSRTSYSVLSTEYQVDATKREYYYQVVISASYELAGTGKATIIERVVDELRAVFPAAREAKLLRSKIVTESEAVFSVQPGSDAFRPSATTQIPGLFLAGDWTATGWPATMEGAVRSGYLAAEGVLQSLGRAERILVDDLPRSLLARSVIR